MWMDGLRDWRKRRGALAALAAAVVALSACNEDLQGGAACPSLCANQEVVIKDTVLEAVSFDTVVAGVPSIGSEGALLLASRGDTLDTRVVMRFDSLVSRVTRSSIDSAVTAVDSVYLLLRVNASRTKVRDSVRVELYNVDTTANDTSAAAILALFRPDRLLGASVFDSAGVKDSMRVYFDNARFLSLVTGPKRLRVGLKVSGRKGAIVSLGSWDASNAASLKYDPVPEDTAIKEVTLDLRSDSPTGNLDLASDLRDYTVIAQAPALPGPSQLSVGGLPSRRTFLRFNVPPKILDSATVLRATLLLTQVPTPLLQRTDSTLLLPVVVNAGEEVTDFARTVELISGSPVDTLRVAAPDSGLRQIEVAAALRQWSSSTNTFRQQRALVIRSNDEGLGVGEARFWSVRAPAGVRPRLRVSYSLRTSFGIP